MSHHHNCKIDHTLELFSIVLSSSDVNTIDLNNDTAKLDNLFNWCLASVKKLNDEFGCCEHHKDKKEK